MYQRPVHHVGITVADVDVVSTADRILEARSGTLLAIIIAQACVNAWLPSEDSALKHAMSRIPERSAKNKARCSPLDTYRRAHVREGYSLHLYLQIDPIYFGNSQIKDFTFKTVLNPY